MEHRGPIERTAIPQEEERERERKGQATNLLCHVPFPFYSFFVHIYPADQLPGS